MWRLDMSTRIHIFHGYGRSTRSKIEIYPVCLSLDRCRIKSGDTKINNHECIFVF